MGQLSAIDLAAMGLYILGMLFIGVICNRKTHVTEDYFLAGRSMTWFPVSISVMMTLISTISFLSTPSNTFRVGLVAVSGVFSVIFVIPVTVKLYAPFFSRLQITSAYEYLERRYHIGIRVLGAVLFVLLRIAWMAMAIHAASLAVTHLVFPQATAVETARILMITIVGLGLFATAYTVLGGMRAVIWTDVAQFFVLFGGIVLTIVLGIKNTPGGVSAIWEVARETGHTQFFDFSLDLQKEFTFFGVLISSISWYWVYYCSDQLVIQRYLSTRSVLEAKRTMLADGVGQMFVTIALGATGLVLFGLFQGRPELFQGVEQADEIFPHFIGTMLPTGIRGLVVAALYAAVMSSVDSGINSICAVLTVDGYRRFVRPKGSPAAELRLARWATVFSGISVILLSLFVVGETGKYLIERQFRFAGYLAAPLFGMFAAGIFSSRSNTGGILLGGGLALILGLLIAFPPPNFPSISLFWLVPLTSAVALIASLSFSYCFPPPSNRKTVGLTYRSLVLNGEEGERK